MADTYTHKDLAGICGVSETTIKSYRRKFPGFIPVLTRGKPIRFKDEAREICLKIRDCFEKGMSVNETYKVLKENFKEQPSSKPRAPRVAAAPAATSAVSEEYLEKFFQTAGQMMHGMAQLATAQVRAGQRLEKLEKALDKLLEIEARNSENFSRLLERMDSPAIAPRAPEPAAPATESEEAAPDKKVRTRKIVNVRGPEGEVKSYTIEKSEEEAAPEAPKPKSTGLERPSDAFLNTPIVIMNEQGEFLGVPGRLSLSGFVEILIREAEEGGVSLSSWRREDDSWVFTMDVPGGDTHDLYFLSTTTPRGNLVVLLDRLDVNNKETSRQFLQEFFRQVKDKI